MQNAENESIDGLESKKEGVWSEKEARRLLKEVDESGEQIAPFARRVGFKAQRLHWWISKLGWKRSRPLKATEPAGPTKPAAAPAKPAASTKQAASAKPAAAPAKPSVPKFVPVRVVPDRYPATAPVNRGAGVVVEVGGRHIRVEAHFDAEVLRRIVYLLEEGQPC